MKSNRDVPVRSKLNANSLMYSGVPRDYVKYTLDDFEGEKQKKILYNYMANIHTMYEEKQDLILVGNNGTGKTMLASILLKQAYYHRYTIAMITMNSLLELTFNQKYEDKQTRLKEILSAQFLVIDELGKETFTQSGSNRNLFENVLRTAHTKGQIIIICSNMDLETIYKEYGKSVKSLIDGTFAKVIFNERDRRKLVQQDKKSVNILMRD